MTRFLKTAVPAAACRLLLAAPAAGAEIDANFVDLGTLGGMTSAAIAVNDKGQVAGASSMAVGFWEHAFLYDQGSMRDIGTLGGIDSAAVDLNEAGQVAGVWRTPDPYFRSFLYSNGVATDLGTLGGFESTATDLNDSGQVVGYSTNASGEVRAFLYADGVMADLGTLGGSDSIAYAINESGQVTGLASPMEVGPPEDPDYISLHAFLYEAGTMRSLGTLGGLRSQGNAINVHGDVTGNASIDGDAAHHAFLYDASDDVMYDLGTLGGSYATGYFVNSSGQVAGTSLIAGNDDTHAFLWSNGQMIDLTTPGQTFANVQHLGEGGEVLFSEMDPETDVHSQWYYKDGVRKLIGTYDGFGIEPLAMSPSGIIAGVLDRHAFVSACPLLPSSTCNDAARGKLQIRDSDDDRRDQIKWKWAAGAEVLQSDLGNPDTHTSYALCLYDSTGGVDSLVTALRAGPGDSWTSNDPKGWEYQDSSRQQHGIGTIQVKPGADGKTKARLSAKGEAVPMPAAFSETEMLDVDPRMTAQLRTSSTSTCWSTALTEVKTNEAAEFSASTP